MLNSRENEVKQKTSSPSGQENNTIIVGLEVVQRVRDEQSQTYEMDAKGKLARPVNPTEYIRIKAYNNRDLIKQKEQKEIGE